MIQTYARAKRPKTSLKPESKRNRAQEMSIPARARQVLMESSEALTGQQLTDRINEKFGTNYAKGSVVGSVARVSRQGEIFSRDERGEYGLLEWKTESPSNTPDDSAPEQGATE